MSYVPRLSRPVTTQVRSQLLSSRPIAAPTTLLPSRGYSSILKSTPVQTSDTATKSPFNRRGSTQIPSYLPSGSNRRFSTSNEDEPLVPTDVVGGGRVKEGRLYQKSNKAQQVTATLFPYKSTLGATLLKAEGSVASLQGQHPDSRTKLRADLLKASMNAGGTRINPRLDELSLEGAHESKKKGKYFTRTTEGKLAIQSGGLISFLFGFPINPTWPKMTASGGLKYESVKTGRSAKLNVGTSQPFFSWEWTGKSEAYQNYLAHKQELINNPEHLQAEKAQLKKSIEHVLLNDPSADQHFVRDQLHRDIVESAAERIAREKRNGASKSSGNKIPFAPGRNDPGN